MKLDAMKVMAILTLFGGCATSGAKGDGDDAPSDSVGGIPRSVLAPNDSEQFAAARRYYESALPEYVAGGRAWQLQAFLSYTLGPGARGANSNWDFTAYFPLEAKVKAAVQAEGAHHCEAHRDQTCKRMGVDIEPLPDLAERLMAAGDLPRAAVAFAARCVATPKDEGACAGARSAVRGLVEQYGAQLGAKTFTIEGPDISAGLKHNGYLRVDDAAQADFALVVSEQAPTFDVQRKPSTYTFYEVTFENIASAAQKDLANKLKFARGKLRYEEEWLGMPGQAIATQEYEKHERARDQYLREVRELEAGLDQSAPDRKAVQTPHEIPATFASLRGSAPCGVEVRAKDGRVLAEGVDECKFGMDWIEHKGSRELDLEPRKGPPDPARTAAALFAGARVNAALMAAVSAFPDYDPANYDAWQERAPTDDELGVLVLKALMNGDRIGKSGYHPLPTLADRWLRDECNVSNYDDIGRMLSESVPPELR